MRQIRGYVIFLVSHQVLLVTSPPKLAVELVAIIVTIIMIVGRVHVDQKKEAMSKEKLEKFTQDLKDFVQNGLSNVTPMEMSGILLHLGSVIAFGIAIKEDDARSYIDEVVEFTRKDSLQTKAAIASVFSALKNK